MLAAYVDGERIVQFLDGATAAARDVARGLVQGRQIEAIQTRAMEHDATGVMERVGIGAGLSVEQAVAALSRRPDVLFAEPNWMLAPAAVSDDPAYATTGQLWGMYGDDQPTAIGPAGTTNQFGSQAERAWGDGLVGSKSVVVGIVDEGFQIDHPDLAANVWVNPFDAPDGIDNDGNGYVDDVNGWDFNSNDKTVYDGAEDDHGTHVAGTIGGVGGNGTGVAGVSWNVTMISTKFFGPNGGTLANAVKALDYLTALKKRHGSGRNGDYTATSGSLTFNPGETLKVVSVSVVNDTLVEADETFVVKLSSASGAAISVGTGTGTIVNDDGVTAQATLAAFAVYGMSTDTTSSTSPKKNR